jgi:hypothetical protein
LDCRAILVVIYDRRPNDKSSFEPFPPLPVELVRCLLEVTAQEDKPTSLALAHVSRTVQQWIRPIIYHTVVLVSENQIHFFRRTLQGPNTILGAIVRRLFIKDEVNYHDRGAIAEVIRDCTQLEYLVTDVDLSDSNAMDIISSSSVAPWHAMLTDTESSLRVPPLGYALLRNVTHLYVDLLKDIEPFQFLPHLTHLGLGCWGDKEMPDYIPRITSLLSLPSIVVILLHAFNDGKPTCRLIGATWRNLSQMEDQRLFAGPGLREDDNIALVRTGGTIWDDADVKYKHWRRRVVGVGQR